MRRPTNNQRLPLWLAALGLLTVGCGGRVETGAEAQPLPPMPDAGGSGGGGGGGGGEVGCIVVAGPAVALQGALTSTERRTDLAIDGPGFFALSEATDATGAIEVAAGADALFVDAVSHRTAAFDTATDDPGARVLYTRDGRFRIDPDGYLADAAGHRVLGSPLDGDTPWGSDEGPRPALAALAPLRVGAAVIRPEPTSTIWVRGNLTADAPIAANAFDLNSPVETGTVVGPAVTLFDSLGARHLVALYFVKTATALWDWHGLTDGGGLTGGTSGTPVEIFSGSLTFDAEGRLVGTANAVDMFNPLGAVNPQRLELDFGSFDYGLTQYATEATLWWSADGASGGALVSLTVGSNGLISGAFTNGETEELGVLAVTLFPAPEMLRDRGGHRFSPTAASGVPAPGSPCEGPRGCVMAGTLEALSEAIGPCIATPIGTVAP